MSVNANVARQALLATTTVSTTSSGSSSSSSSSSNSGSSSNSDSSSGTSGAASMPSVVVDSMFVHSSSRSFWTMNIEGKKSKGTWMFKTTPPSHPRSLNFFPLTHPPRVFLTYPLYMHSRIPTLANISNIFSSAVTRLSLHKVLGYEIWWTG